MVTIKVVPINGDPNYANFVNSRTLNIVKFDSDAFLMLKAQIARHGTEENLQTKH